MRLEDEDGNRLEVTDEIVDYITSLEPKCCSFVLMEDPNISQDLKASMLRAGAEEDDAWIVCIQ